MRKLILFFLCSLAAAQVIPSGGGLPTSSIVGQITTSTGGPIKNGTLTFSLSQPAIAAGTSTVVTQATACYTASSGNIVGIPDPIALPVVTTNTASGTLPSGTYYVAIYYVDATSHVSALSPETTVVLSSTGKITVNAPVLQPAAAIGYGIAISTTSGTETIQGSVTGWTQFVQSTPLVGGSTPIASNNSSCYVWFSDALIPTGTYYTVSLANKNGSLIAGFPQTWCTYGGATGTIDVSQGAPTGVCNTKGVFYPTPIFSNPSGSQSIHSAMTMSGPTTLNGKTTVSSLCNSSGPLDVVACFGADPTGVTDSTSALNGAFANVSNATRYIPAGVYKISSTLNIDTRYRVEGVPGTETTPYSTIIQAAGGFAGTMAKVVSTYAQTSVVLGGMQGLFFDCSAHASIGMIYGGDATLTTFGYRTTDTVFHNCTTAGVQVAANAWLLSWFNVGFQGNGGDGFQVLDQANEGENLNCYGCSFSNNTGNGLTMGPATLAQHDFHCFSCSFDTNSGWQIQNQTVSSGDSLVDLQGSYIFAHQKWIKNFGRLTISGNFYNDGSSSVTLGYLIDNEGLLQAFGGRWTNSGGGAYFNPAQTGKTQCLAVPVIPNDNCNAWIDGNSGNALFAGLTAFNLTVTNDFTAVSGLLFSHTPPTISTHFNTSGDSISFSNGSAAFRIVVGSGAGTSTGALTLPVAPNHWNCFIQNKTRAALVLQTGDTNASATFTNFGTTFAATNWTNGDILEVNCMAL
jgi:hypothetical protein